MISYNHQIDPGDGDREISLNLTRFCAVFNFWGDILMYLFIQPFTSAHKTSQTYIAVYSHAFLSEKCVKLQNMEI
jgi:hypothetical protein